MQSVKTPTTVNIKLLDIDFDVHVDDGYASFLPGENETVTFGYFEKGLVFDLRRMRKKEGDGQWLFGCTLSETRFETVLDMMGVQNCKPSTSPTLDKMNRVMMDNCDKNLSCQSKAVCTQLYLLRRRPDLHSVDRWMCKRLNSSGCKFWQQLDQNWCATLQAPEIWRRACREAVL